MAIAGQGGWICSNVAILKHGRIEFIDITHNRPKEFIAPLDEAVRRLQAGEYVTVDVRWDYMHQLRQAVNTEAIQ